MEESDGDVENGLVECSACSIGVGKNHDGVIDDDSEVEGTVPFILLSNSSTNVIRYNNGNY